MSNKSYIESDRKCTNVWFLVISIVFICVTLLLVGFCWITSTPSRFGKPYDDCGYFCGETNVDIQEYDYKCSFQQKDHRDKPKLQIKLDPKTNKIRHDCVKKCYKGYKEKFNYCIKRNQIKEFGKDTLIIADGSLEAIFYTWDSILMICFVAFCFSYISLFLFRYVAFYVIWIINVGCILFLIFLTFAAIYMKENLVAVVMAIMAIILIVLLIVFRRRIGLVATLFRVASKALMDIPAIMFEPFLTFIFLLMTFIIFIKFSIIIETSAEVRRYKEDNRVKLNYEDRFINDLAHVFNVVTFAWFTQFIFGCQHFVIADTIVQWYFTPDKEKLGNPILTSFKNLLRYHLGSICLGASLITIVKVVKTIVELIRNQLKNTQSSIGIAIAYCLRVVIGAFDEFLEYLVRNAYIIVAKEGTEFIESGKRASHLLTRNIVDVIALNNFGDLVLFICRLLIVLIAGFVGYGMLDSPDTRDNMYPPLILGIVFAFLIAHCFVTVFEMTIDTIFICYCIDCEENDGDLNPYHMSDCLKKILMDMKEHSSMFLLTNEGGKDAEFRSGIADGSSLPMLVQKNDSHLIHTTNPFMVDNEDGHQVYQQDVDEHESYLDQVYQN
ncbi:unnamed protein product [Chironomus riparius]|uniref:Choline transporter-like protein n=2 Tax=Chironomus riparius TaxID=315576 RepID=A0A9P0J9N5_9DIPT|nr:unnamed protein product [Chironomus riparius]